MHTHIHMPLTVISFRETEVSMKNLVPCSQQFPEAKAGPLDSYNARVRFFPQGMCEDVGKLEKHILIQLPPHA